MARPRKNQDAGEIGSRIKMQAQQLLESVAEYEKNIEADKSAILAKWGLEKVEELAKKYGRDMAGMAGDMVRVYEAHVAAHEADPKVPPKESQKLQKAKEHIEDAPRNNGVDDADNTFDGVTLEGRARDTADDANAPYGGAIIGA